MEYASSIDVVAVCHLRCWARSRTMWRAGTRKRRIGSYDAAGNLAADPAPVVRQRHGPVPLGQGPGGGPPPVGRLTSVETAEIIRTVLSEEGHLRGAAQGRRRRCPIGPWACFPRDTGGGRESRRSATGLPTLLGAGACSRAVEELLRWQFQEMGVSAYGAPIPRKMKSRRVQEKCGFRHVCDTPPSPWPDGTERPGVCQAITRQEWEVRHGG